MPTATAPPIFKTDDSYIYNLAPNVEGIPSDLREHPNWVLWKLEPRETGGKPQKVPYQDDLATRASSIDSSTWTDFESLRWALPGDQSFGAGFALGKEGTDDLLVIDLDNCRDPETGALTELAQTLVTALNGYAEVSASLKGLHIFVRWKGTLPANRAEGIEAYQKGRYIAMTGEVLSGSSQSIPWRQEEINEHLIPLLSRNRTSTRLETWKGETSSSPRASAPVSAFSSGRFELLHDGKWREAGYTSQSEADLAMCSHFHATGSRTAEAIDAAFRKTGLYRDKWDEKHAAEGRSYGTLTIEKVLLNPPGGIHQVGSRKEGGRSEKKPVLLLRSTDLLPSRETSSLRFPAGIATLDSLLGGGLEGGRLYVLQGPPGAGKSTLMVQVAASLSAKLPVLFISVDEHPRESMRRLVQVMGLSRAEACALDNHDEARIEVLERGRNLLYWPLDCRLDTEELQTCLSTLYSHEAPPVVVLDSIQSLVQRDFGDRPQTEALNHFLSEMSLLAAQSGAICLMTSQQNRESYRTPVSGRTTNPIAASQGSSAIEYQAGVLLSLTQENPLSPVRTLSIVKSRLGPQGGHLRLFLLEDRAFFEEIDEALAQTSLISARSMKAETEDRAVETRILKVLQEAGTELNQSALLKKVKGKHETAITALKRMNGVTIVYRRIGTSLLYSLKP